MSTHVWNIFGFGADARNEEGENGQQFFRGTLQSMMSSEEGMQMAFKPEDMGKMMQMMGSFTVLRMVGLMGAAGKKVSKEQMLALNAQLNQIRKPQK